MSDYLSRLAERALGLVETVQPLTPPMFAQAPSMPVESLNPDQTTPRPEAKTEILREAQAAPRAHAPTEKRTPPDLPERLPAHASDADGATLVPRRPAALESSAHLRRVETAPEPAPSQEHPTSTSRTGETPSTRTQGQTGEPVLVPASSSNSHTANETTAHARPHNSEDDAAANRAPSPRSADQITHLTHRHETLIKTISPIGAHDDTGRQRSRLRNAGDAAESPAAKQEGHPVRVQIGRIEVRAVNAPPAATEAPRRSSAPAPRLSLEEYLRARNGGRR